MKSALRVFVLAVATLTVALYASNAYAAGALRPVWGSGLQGNEQAGGGFKLSVGLTNSVSFAIPISIVNFQHPTGKGVNAFLFTINTNHKEIDLQGYVAPPNSGWFIATAAVGPSTLLVSGFRPHVPKSTGTTPVFTAFLHITGTDNTQDNSLVDDWVIKNGFLVHFGDVSAQDPGLSTTTASGYGLSLGIDHIRPVSVEDQSWGRIKDMYRE